MNINDAKCQIDIQPCFRLFFYRPSDARSFIIAVSKLVLNDGAVLWEMSTNHYVDGQGIAKTIATVFDTKAKFDNHFHPYLDVCILDGYELRGKTQAYNYHEDEPQPIPLLRNIEI